MSKRDWVFAGTLGIIIVALLGWAIFQTGYSIGEQTGEYQANTDTYARHAQKEIRNACSGLNGVAQTECTIQIVEVTNQHERAEGDLIAQRNMAKWALWMLVATALMAIVTAFGVYYVWRALLATQKMAADARRI